MRNEPTFNPPRTIIAAAAAAITLCAASLALIPALLSGASEVMVPVAIVVALGSLGAFLPLIAGPAPTASSFGSLALFGTFVTTLGSVALGFLVSIAHPVEKHPFWIGVLIGSGSALIAQVALAVCVLRKAAEHAKQINGAGA